MTYLFVLKPEEKHDELFNEVMKRLEQNNMRVNPMKLQYARKEINILGVRNRL